MSPVGYTLGFVFPSFFYSVMRHTILFMGSTIGEVHSKVGRGFAAFRDLLTQGLRPLDPCVPCLGRLCVDVASITMELNVFLTRLSYQMYEVFHEAS